MPAPLSKDIRKRIIQAVEKGDSVKKIAQEKQVSESAIFRLLVLYRETGSYAPRPLNNGRKPRPDEEMLKKIRPKIEEQPDITLKELIETFSLPVSEAALCKTVNKKLKLGRKKNGARGRTASSRCIKATQRVEK